MSTPPETGEEAPRRPADARLVAPALSTWSAAAAVQAPWPAARIALWCGVAILVAAAALPGRTGGLVAPVRLPRLSGRRAVALGCLACALGAAAVAALHTARVHDGVLRAAARRHLSVTVRATVTADPHVSAGHVVGTRLTGGTVVVPASVELVSANGRSWRLREPVLVLATSSRWRGLLPSQRVLATGQLAPPRGGDQYGAVLVARGPPALLGRPSLVQRVAGRLRDGLRQAASGLPTAERGLLPGLVDGDTSGLPTAVSDQFRATGLTHLVAVSGENCAIVTGVVVALTRRSRLGRRSRSATAAVALLGFVVLARPSASVLRAAVMGLLGIGALAAGRPRAALPGLGAAVVVLVLVDPSLAVSAGFALSVLATAGLLILAPGWRETLALRLPARLADVVAIPLAAQVACAPVIAWIGGGVSLVAVPANVAALPAVPVATVLGVLAAVVSPAWPRAAAWLAHLAGVPCGWLVSVARVGSGLPGAQIGWSDGMPGALGLLCLAAVLGWALRRRRSRRLLAALAAGVVAAQVVLGTALARRWPPPGWDLAVCDVGQGDALVLAAGAGSGVLVDAGPDPPALSRCLHQLGIRRLSLVILTHLHADHVEGLTAVLGRVPVGAVEIGPLLEPRQEWDRVRGWAAAAHVPIVRAQVGEVRSVGGLSWQVLGPPRVLHDTDSDPNNNSLVLRVRSGGVSMLLTGDAESEEQGEFAGDPDLAADVLKVPHHGSADQDPSFLAAVGARVALVSVGAGNTYGHPSARTLTALSRLGVRTFRTDEDGTLVVLRRRGVLTVVPGHPHRSIVPAPAGSRRGS